MKDERQHRRVPARLAAAIGFAAAIALTGCPAPTPPTVGDEEDANTNTGTAAGPAQNAVWSKAFDTTESGILSAIWGAAGDDIFVVGGTSQQGEVRHFNGQTWQAMGVPEITLLTGVYGFGPADVFAVGEGGAFIHYDGVAWRGLDSGTDRNLRGIWGKARDDLWIVGGDADQGTPVIIHFDGSNSSEVAVPANDRDATALFKVWGFGSKIFAVGSNGLIIEYNGSEWRQSPTGPAADADFLALWGTSERNMVAVGGRAGGRISVYDGSGWRTQLVSGITGLNAVHMVAPEQAIIGGLDGYLGNFNPLANTLVPEDSGSDQTVHAIWGDGSDRFYAVGGSVTPTFSGLALLRTIETPSGDVPPPDETTQPEDPTPPDETAPPDNTGPQDEPAPPDDATPPGDTPPPDDTAPPTETAVALEIGLSSGDAFVSLRDGDTVPLFFVGRSQVAMSLTLRARGFASGARVTLSGTIARTADGLDIVNPIVQTVDFVEIERGLNEVRDYTITVNRATPDEVANQEVLLFFVITDQLDPRVNDAILRTVILAPPTR